MTVTTKIQAVRVLICVDHIEDATPVINNLESMGSLKILMPVTLYEHAMPTLLQKRPDVVIIVNQHEDKALDLCSRLKVADRTTAIHIWLKTDQVTSDFAKRLLDAGGSNFYRPTDPLEVIKESLTNSMIPKSNPYVANEMVAVYSPVGGSGCSTIAANLAGILAMSTQHGKVALADFDWEFGVQADRLSLSAPYPTVYDLIDVAFEPGAVTDTMTLKKLHRSKALHVLPAPSSMAQANHLDEQLASEIITKLLSEYVSVIDLPTQFSAITKVVLRQSTRIIVVCPPSILALRKLCRVIEELGDENRLQKMMLFFNKTRKNADYQPADLLTFAKRRGLQVCGMAAYDSSEFDRYMNGRLMIQDSQPPPFIKALHRLAVTTGIYQGAVNQS